jgi:hypothetical protein
MEGGTKFHFVTDDAHAAVQGSKDATGPAAMQDVLAK